MGGMLTESPFEDGLNGLNGLEEMSYSFHNLLSELSKWKVRMMHPKGYTLFYCMSLVRIEEGRPLFSILYKVEDKKKDTVYLGSSEELALKFWDDIKSLPVTVEVV